MAQHDPAVPAGLPAGRAVALDDRVVIRGGASVVLGGAPFGVLRIAPAARPFVRRLHHAGAAGLVPSPGVERAVVDLLLARGIVHPVAHIGTAEPHTVAVVVPAYQCATLLEACLASLRTADPDVQIVVVDDASPDAAVGAVALAHGATLIRHPVNRGPAAARNTGLAAVTAEVVAFVDADCAVTAGWLGPLLPHFDDARVAAVAPRISPRSDSDGPLARYEITRSALDMGPRPELVTPGAPLGYLPSAALLIRRSALGSGFDEQLRVGEDVDLIWRLVDAGWMVRYEPASQVTHRTRPQLFDWAARHFAYGTSAAELDRRHPGRLTPARLSPWSAAVGLLVLARRPSPGLAAATGAGVAAVATGLLARTLRRSSVDPQVAPILFGKGLLSDVAATGHLLRREWWPIGWLALVLAPKSRVARAAAASMLAPIAQEWLTGRTQSGVVRYFAMRLLEDAAYGSGVIASAARRRRPGVLLPRMRHSSARDRRSRPTGPQ